MLQYMLQDFNRHEIKVLTSENHADRVKVWCSTVQTAYDPQQVLVAGLGAATLLQPRGPAARSAASVLPTTGRLSKI